MIYKILTAREWQQFQVDGIFAGAPVDKADGFMHFSAREQVAETARKHFAGQTQLVLCGVDEDKLGDLLRWEVSRGGDKFPHLYSTLKIDQVETTQTLDNFLSD